MSDWLAELPYRRDGVTIPAIWLALALSLLIHAAVLWQWLPRVKLPSPEELKLPGPGSLVVRLTAPPAPPPAPPPSPAVQMQRPPAPPARPSTPPAQSRPAPLAQASPAPPVIALNPPATEVQSSPAPTPATAAPLPQPAAGDLSSYIEARRRARAEAAPPAAPVSAPRAPQVEDDRTRANRIATANLAQQQSMTFGYDPTKNGGVFTIQRMGYSSAEFMFYGWNPDMRRNTAQLIEVQKGNNSDIYLAVVRKMISIVREQVHEEDFRWESRRLGRSLMLSARVKDNAALEDFLLDEFFFNQRPSR